MGFSFRKSINLGGFRINLSKSGVGFSTGFKGFRVRTGPRGTYVHMGTNGIYYQRKIGGAFNPSNSEIKPSLDNGDPTVIHTRISVNQLRDTYLDETINLINERIDTVGYFKTSVLITIICFILAAMLSGELQLLIAITGAFISYLFYHFDITNKTSPLFYEMDSETVKRFKTITENLNRLEGAQRIWKINYGTHVTDLKRNAGASVTINREPCHIEKSRPKFLATNIEPFCLNINSHKFYFMPDRLFIFGEGHYTAIPYVDVRVVEDSTIFIEEDSVPSDSEVVGHTWKYINKNGGPDLRFNNNREIPKLRYGTLKIEIGSAMHVTIYVSSILIMKDFAETIRSIKGWNNTQIGFVNQQSAHENLKNETLPTCYKILGLQKGVSREVATAAYRELAKSYHPDRVSHLSTEFREMAEERMKDINAAYEELQNIEGWNSQVA